MMQRLTLLTFLLFIFLLTDGQAQNYGGGIHFRTGLSFINTEDFTTDNDNPGSIDEINGNFALNSFYDIEEVNSTVLSIGMGGYGVTKDIIYDFEFLVGSNMQFNQSTDTTVDGEEGERIFNGLYLAELFVSGGYIPYRKEGFVTYPLIGFGISHAGMLLQTSGATSPKENLSNYPAYVDEEMQSRENVYLYTNTFAMKFAGRAEYHFGANTPERAKGFTLALELGYRLAMASVWRANSDALDGSFGGLLDEGNHYEAPEWAPGGVYLRLLVGGGRVGNK